MFAHSQKHLSRPRFWVLFFTVTVLSSFFLSLSVSSSAGAAYRWINATTVEEYEARGDDDPGHIRYFVIDSSTKTRDLPKVNNGYLSFPSFALNPTTLDRTKFDDVYILVPGGNSQGSQAIQANLFTTEVESGGKKEEVQTTISIGGSTNAPIHLYKTNEGKIKSVHSDRSQVSFKQLSGDNRIYYQEEASGSTCPALLIFNGSQWGFIAGKRDNDGKTQGDASSVAYRGILTMAGYPDVYGPCIVKDTNATRTATEEILGNLIFKDKNYWIDNYKPCSGTAGLDLKAGGKWMGFGSIATGAVFCLGPNAIGSTSNVLDPSKAQDPPYDQDDGRTSPTEGSSCTVEGVGWIICPVVTFMANLSDGAFGIIEGALKVNVKLFSTDSGTYTAWGAFRNIANVAFVIAFIIIIYSQLTGMGISNYGVKKTLPRLIITVILVNISFFVCQLAVDLTQILGGTINSLFDSIATNDGQKLQWTPAIGDILAGAGIALGLVAVTGVAVSTVALSISVPVLLAALISVLMIVVILIGRQAAIVILIVLAPLAFVAFLLPNTEQWFKRWLKMFWALLMVYPIIALLYAGGALASRILINASEGDFWLSITALGVAAIPLIMTPSLLRGALNATGKVGAKLSGVAAGANSNVKSKALSQSRLGEARQGLKNRFALRGAARRTKPDGTQQKIDNSRMGKFLGLDKGAARAINAVDKAASEEVEASVAKIMSETTSTNRLKDEGVPAILESAIKSGDAVRARAAQKVLLNSGGAGLAKLQKVYEKADVAKDMMRTDREDLVGTLRTELNGAGLKGKNNALARFGYDGNADSLASHVSDVATYNRLNAVELAGQSPANLQTAREHNIISRDTARAVLANSAASALLDTEKRDLFTKIANGVEASANAGAATGTSAPVDAAGISGQLRDFTRDQLQSMTPEAVQQSADVRGGIDQLNDGDVMAIRNTQSGTATGDAARQEAINRGLINEVPKRDPNTMPDLPPRQ